MLPIHRIDQLRVDANRLSCTSHACVAAQAPTRASSPSFFAYGSALNLDVYLYLLMPDGAYTFERDKPHFHHPPAPSPGELHELLNNVS